MNPGSDQVPPDQVPPGQVLSDQVLDDALAALDGYGPEFGHGLANHGPMAAEALVALGRSEDVPAFVTAYRRRLRPAPPPGRALPPGEWEGALGRVDRWADWVALFDRELDAEPFDEVTARWVPRLAPGSMAAATHGLIRTAHAVRSLCRAGATPGSDRPAAPSRRRDELARGLAYWAARYQEVPGPPLLVGRDGVEAALAGLPVLPEEAPREWLIADRVRHLDMVAAPFEQAVAALAPPDDPAAALAQLAAGGAVAYLANAEDGDAVALVHAVTAPMALDLLLPVVDGADRPTVFAYAWQAVAALHACFAPRRGAPPAVDDRGGDDEPFDQAVLAAAAAASGDEHAIKLAEAAYRAYAATGHPALPAAAVDAASRLG
ncbi:MAG TPA: hypothetical protein VHB02_01390 [Acidimicrobiales bacterium]|nr:hypothetical protein [Acidimicrobiales bacterium]